MKFSHKYSHYAHGEFGRFEFYIHRIEQNKDLTKLAKIPLHDWWVDFQTKDSSMAGMYRVRVNGLHDVEDALLYGMSHFINALHEDRLWEV